MSDENTQEQPQQDPPAPAELEKPKASWIWMKDSAGYPSITVTFSTVSFWVTTLAYILSIVEKLGPLEIRPFDVAACSAYMVPILGLYFGRRWTDAKFSSQK